MFRIAVHATPKASREEVAGWRGSELSVRVTVAPEDGKANAAVCKVVARALGVAPSRVKVVRGEASRHKVLEVDADPERLVAAFGVPDGVEATGSE